MPDITSRLSHNSHGSWTSLRAIEEITRVLATHLPAHSPTRPAARPIYRPVRQSLNRPDSQLANLLASWNEQLCWFHFYLLVVV